jgi:RNA 3'-phosphate cyclase
MIEIDGSIGEAGGQILRTACALSAVTKKPCRIFNIRKSRPKPGLATQHLLGLQALAKFTKGRLEGDCLGSEKIKFQPQETRGEDLDIKIKTAGSIVLLLQTLIPPAMFASGPVKITIDGGATDTFFSPTFDHFRYCFLKILEKIGGKVDVSIIKRGYYPEGGAKVEATIYPFQPNHLNLFQRGKIKRVLVISGASEFLKQKKVAERQIAGVKEVLGKLKLPIEERFEYYKTQSPGSQTCLIAEFENTIIGTDNLGKLGKRAEDVGKESALELLEEERSNTCLDKHSADQFLPYLALAKGKSLITTSEITNHSKTNIQIIEKFINGKFEIKDNSISFASLT